MKIAVFGASGRVGQEVTTEALRRGHEVNAFIHRANPFERQSIQGLKLFQGDVHDKEAVSGIVSKSDVV
jgi:putative NADH-flavin reductase